MEPSPCWVTSHREWVNDKPSGVRYLRSTARSRTGFDLYPLIERNVEAVKFRKTVQTVLAGGFIDSSAKMFAVDDETELGRGGRKEGREALRARTHDGGTHCRTLFPDVLHTLQNRTRPNVLSNSN